MKIHLRQILKSGFELALDAREPWFVAILDTLFPEKNLDKSSVSGRMHLENHTGTIAVSGNVKFTHREQCARCGGDLNVAENIALTANLIPRTAITGEDPISKVEEKELTEDDLDYSFYDKEEIFIDPIVNDGIALALPYNYYCKDQTACKKNVEAFVQPHSGDSIDPRWLTLKDLKH